MEPLDQCMLQAPKQLTVTATSPGLSRGTLGVRRAFAVSGRKERERWLRALLGEVHSLEATQGWEVQRHQKLEKGNE